MVGECYDGQSSEPFIGAAFIKAISRRTIRRDGVETIWRLRGFNLKACAEFIAYGDKSKGDLDTLASYH